MTKFPPNKDITYSQYKPDRMDQSYQKRIIFLSRDKMPMNRCSFPHVIPGTGRQELLQNLLIDLTGFNLTLAHHNHCTDLGSRRSECGGNLSGLF
jgi:hypothetical protein